MKQQWEEIKAKERKDAGEAEKTVLSGVPQSMPSLLRAYELSTRAAQVGFDWVTTDDVIDKAEEEIRELREAVAEGGGKSAEEYVRESLTNPEAFLAEGFGNAMPSFEGRLTDEQIQALVDYLLQNGGG